MSKFKHKKTGDIIHAHLFDGDIDKLKEALPYIDYDNPDFISDHCLCVFGRNRYHMYNHSNNGNFFLNNTKADFEENFEPYIEPTISNAQQAIKWLEDGKKIRKTTWVKNQYIYLNGYVMYDENDLKVHLSFTTLFSGNWELYEEPKYKEVSGNWAIMKFLKHDKRVSVVLDKEEEFFLSYDKDGFLSLITNDGEKCLINLTHIARTDWRIYEEK